MHCTMDYYSTIKRNVLVIYAATWMNLKSIMLSKRQIQKATHCLIPFKWHSKKGETIERVNRLVVPRNQSVGRVGDCPGA